jgi:putative tryptophan/tyrosine transport system substrate-binding protein
MRRREFIALVGSAAGAWPLSARAQQPDKVWRIGFIAGASRPTLSELANSFVQSMRALGYLEGKNFIIEWRSAEGNYEQFPALAAELVQSKADVIVTGITAAVQALRGLTTTIPIVMAYSTDPVGNGFVSSLAHPDGNITGLAGSSDDTSPKQLELLKTFVPHVTRVGLLGNPNTETYSSVQKGVRDAARKIEVSIVSIEAENSEQITTAFATFRNERVQAVLVAVDAVFFLQRRRIAELALSNHLPSIASLREYVTAGGFMSYGESLSNFFRRAAIYVDKIIKGAKPSDLPVEQPTKFELVINRPTAKALNLDVPARLLALTDEVIE